MKKVIRITESELKSIIENTISNENKTMDKWYLVKIGNEFFAEKITELKYHDKPAKVLFRDSTGKVMSFGKDEKWASDLIKDKNEIEGNF